MVHIDGQGYKRVSYDIGLTMRLLQGVKELNERTTEVYTGNGLAEGDVVAFEDTNHVTRSTYQDSRNAIGVVTGKSEIRISKSETPNQNKFGTGQANSNDQNSNIETVRVAFSGRTQIKVTEENGEIKAGDRLTVSKTLPGYAMKMTESGQSIGIALESSAAGTDKILVFVNLGYQRIDVAVNASGDKMVYDKDIDMSGFSLLNVKAIASLSGKWAIAEDGTITATKVVADEIETKKLKIAGAETSTVGRATIVAGAQELVVENENVTEKSTVLITFRGNVAGPWWVAEQQAGWFKIKVSQPPSVDVGFDYWIVETDLASAEASASQQEPLTSPTSSEPAAEESNASNEPEPLTPNQPAEAGGTPVVEPDGFTTGQAGQAEEPAVEEAPAGEEPAASEPSPNP
ncbi:MAG: hypothetical protein A2720_00335 [Candidatus Doudnabacteria bacterium RIFCSPHIGHO2_01_FULL_46_24]|uniref:Uncharacterized protein n=1 Tax=Candidatus Doudnabacteria bacterium RIFCSPHIGHO2_01_FULL_46_24 TaxID=1817825 RepID=A0A1F5NTD7_9BACT|nr:MAG: hypothetical protein A2720_00335 [Candidatus Doudnabacteria bacterium RIFCSPHIGHO2_01_FULL_46_24]